MAILATGEASWDIQIFTLPSMSGSLGTSAKTLAQSDRALFDLAIHGKLRGCDLVKPRIGDLVSGGHFVIALPSSSKKRAGPCSPK